MAVAAHHLTTGSSSASNTYTTDSISPNSGRLILCAVQVSIGTPPTPAVSLSGCGLTWVEVAKNDTSGSSNLYSRTSTCFGRWAPPRPAR